MIVELTLPSAIEGVWTLKGPDGKVIAESVEGAVLRIDPRFYQGQSAQTIARVYVKGKKGKEVRNTLRISANAGKVTSEVADKVPSQIVPKFDRED